MTTDKINKKALFLVENGFCEREFIQAQNALLKMGAFCRIISTDTGLLRGWNEEKNPENSGWGQEYAPDVVLADCIPSDYDILVIPGGERSVNKLKNCESLHTIIASFLNTGKPVVTYNMGTDLINFVGLSKGYSIATKDSMCETVKKAGGRCAPENMVVSKNLISLTRYREESEEKLKNAITAILNKEPYIEKTASSGDLPQSHQAA